MTPQTPPDFGTFPPDDLRRAFVAGAKWWEWKSRGATMWPSDRDLAEAEAERRYQGGKPAPATLPHMTDAEQVRDACRQHGLRCSKCRLTALVILHLLGLDRGPGRRPYWHAFQRRRPGLVRPRGHRLGRVLLARRVMGGGHCGAGPG